MIHSVLLDGTMTFFFQAEDGIRYLVRSRGLGDVYKRQVQSQDGINTLGRPTVRYYINPQIKKVAK